MPLASTESPYTSLEGVSEFLCKLLQKTLFIALFKVPYSVTSETLILELREGKIDLPHGAVLAGRV